MMLDPVEHASLERKDRFFSSLMKIGVWLHLQKGNRLNMQTFRDLISHLNFYSIVSFTPLCCIITLMEGTVGETVYLRMWNEERKKAVVTRPAHGRGVQCR